MSLALRVLTPEEVREHDEYLRKAAIAHAWHLWELASCEERGGHWWFLDICPDDGTTLFCTGCNADVFDLCPDDPGLMLAGEFEVYPGYVLKLDEGRVIVNDRYPPSTWHEPEPFTYGWRGPVTVSFRVEKHGGYFEPAEYDAWIDLEPA